MQFVKYKGEPIEGLRKGAVYLSNRYSFRAVDPNDISVKDDEGAWVDMSSSIDDFDMLSGVFAVWLGSGPKPLPDSKTGDVFYFDDADTNGRTVYRVEGGKFFASENFEIIDGTNFIPGAFLRDRKSGQWVRVLSVERTEDSINVTVESDPDDSRTITDFALCANESGIMLTPMLECVDVAGAKNLTVGTWYQLIETLEENVVVVNDAGDRVMVSLKRFG